MVQWIANFIPNVALELGPFHNVISKSKKNPTIPFSQFMNDPLIKNLFIEIKKKVGTPKVLSLPDFSKPFEIEVDSSQAGVGASLTQEGRLIAIASKPLMERAKRWCNIHRETAGVMWSIEKFYKYIGGSRFKTKIFTDNRVSSFLRESKDIKLRRWKAMIDNHPVELCLRKEVNMKISDPLSRLIERDGRELEKNLSDELMEEVVIASLGTDISENDLIQVHYQWKHCSPERLDRITGCGITKAKAVCQKCNSCVLKKPVQKVQQILGTIKDHKIKNHTWFFDLVKWKGIWYLSILDRSTRFFMLGVLKSKHHAGIEKNFRDFFAKMGKPKNVVYDRELHSELLQNYFTKNGISFFPLPRHSPNLNIVERYHAEAKSIAKKSGEDFSNTPDTLNSLPFTRIPKNSGLRNISPADLFFKNNKKDLQAVCDFLESESKKRSLRSEKLRGKNITRFQRIFSVGDIVKFMTGQDQNKVSFGKISQKITPKIYKIDRIDGTGQHTIHAHELELVTIPESLLTTLLENRNE